MMFRKSQVGRLTPKITDEARIILRRVGLAQLLRFCDGELLTLSVTRREWRRDRGCKWTSEVGCGGTSWRDDTSTWESCC
jgi:hypothetical protein